MATRPGRAGRALLMACLCLAAARCAAPRDARRAVPSYDTFTGKLVQLGADLNGDGRLDQWTYMDGNRPLRGEADTDEDGRVDRWEYFSDQAALQKVGTSSRNDGIEDTWTWGAAATGEVQVELSRRRDRSIDRHEFFRKDALERAEEDTNTDGLPDKWERYENGALREVSFDTSFRLGHPNRRLVYDAQGQLLAMETDVKGVNR